MAVLWLAVSAGAADGFQGEASGTIQATATVVPSLGFTDPHTTLSVSTASHDLLGAYEPMSDEKENPSREQLMLRYPSGGIVLMVGDGCGNDCTVDLSLSGGYVETGEMDRSGVPGAALLNLHRLSADYSTNETNLVITLVYSEN